MTQVTPSPAEGAAKTPNMAFAELVGLVAAAMALNALAIDMMLPALGQIGADLGAAQDNDRQLIIVLYVVANGLSQLLFGPIVDRFGRKRVLLWSLAGYTMASVFCVMAPTFTTLIVARMIQGASTAATRVAAVAIVRDLHSGRTMAKVMSFAVTVFMAAPIIAPALGQIVLAFGPWRMIFAVLLFYGVALTVWVAFRTPETLTPEKTKPIDARVIAATYGQFLGNKTAMGYTIAAAFCFGALFGYISASEQIFLETFEIGDRFAIAFAAIAISLAAASFLNASLVSRYGMRRLTHWALALFIVVNIIHFAIVYMLGDKFLVFMTCTSLSFFALGLIGPNTNAIVMEPMGHIAGAAAAAHGFAGTTLAGALGGLVARAYDGTTLPIVIGFVAFGAIALAIVYWTEDGKLFQPHHSDDAP
ncbi:MAG: multidrug effflux MFS transporter [Pseudomonadota bacterium]